MSRSVVAQLGTARMLLAQFVMQIQEHEESGAHADRIVMLREGRDKWEKRVAELSAQLPEMEEGTDE